MLRAATIPPESRISAPTGDAYRELLADVGHPAGPHPVEVGEQFGAGAVRVGRLRGETFGQQPLGLLVGEAGEQGLPDRGAVRR
jgi:hypothetical protein